SVNVLRGPLAPLSIALHVELGNVDDQVTGSVTDGNFNSPLGAKRNVFNGQLNPALQAGTDSFWLTRIGEAAPAMASAASRILTDGIASIHGTLQDGRRFGMKSLLATNGDFPFYVSFDRGSEVIIGWLNFAAEPAGAASGTVIWVREGTNAFSMTLQASGASVR